MHPRCNPRHTLRFRNPQVNRRVFNSPDRSSVVLPSRISTSWMVRHFLRIHPSRIPTPRMPDSGRIDRSTGIGSFQTMECRFQHSPSILRERRWKCAVSPSNSNNAQLNSSVQDPSDRVFVTSDLGTQNPLQSRNEPGLQEADNPHRPIRSLRSSGTAHETIFNGLGKDTSSKAIRDARHHSSPAALRLPFEPGSLHRHNRPHNPSLARTDRFQRWYQTTTRASSFHCSILRCFRGIHWNPSLAQSGTSLERMRGFSSTQASHWDQSAPATQISEQETC